MCLRLHKGHMLYAVNVLRIFLYCSLSKDQKRRKIYHQFFVVVSSVCHSHGRKNVSVTLANGRMVKSLHLPSPAIEPVASLLMSCSSVSTTAVSLINGGLILLRDGLADVLFFQAVAAPLPFADAFSRVLHGLVPLINMQKLHF